LLVAVVTSPTKGTRLSIYDPHSVEQTKVTSEAVCKALSKLGHQVKVLEAGSSLLLDLEHVHPDAVFNIATGYQTKKDQANIAAMLELSGIPFTGSGFRAHVIGLQKHLAKMLFQLHGIPTPKFLVFNSIEDVRKQKNSLKQDLRFPVIVKPAAEGSSVGISKESVVNDFAKVESLVAKVINDFGAPVLAEEFISGREFTVALLGYPEPRVLPVEEIIFNEAGMYTYGVKSVDNVKPVCPADIPEDLKESIQLAAKNAFMAVGCRDVGRVDIRVSEDGTPFVLEVNTLPGLMPEYSEVPRIAQKAGIDYTRLIHTILEGALKRSAC